MNHVRDLLPADNYIIDLAVLDKGQGDIVVIELNPFGPNTGPSLFSWQGDRRLLQGGLDVYGDLEEHETTYPPGVSLEPSVQRKAVVVDEKGTTCEFRWRSAPLESAVLVWESHWSAIEEPPTEPIKRTVGKRQSTICVLS